MTGQSNVRWLGPVATLLMLLALLTLPGDAVTLRCWCSRVSAATIAVNRHISSEQD